MYMIQVVRGRLLREFDLGERLQTIMIEWSGREDKLDFRSANETLHRDGDISKFLLLQLIYILTFHMQHCNFSHLIIFWMIVTRIHQLIATIESCILNNIW